KGYHPIKPTYALSAFIHKTIKNPTKDEVNYAVLDIVDDSVVKVFDVKYDDKGPKSIPSAKKFKFEASKNGISVQEIFENECADIRVAIRLKTDIKIRNNKSEICILNKTRKKKLKLK
ncbi:hypothetical protein CWI39_0609p0020, partial [Hamiltosporidium magnivora]